MPLEKIDEEVNYISMPADGFRSERASKKTFELSIKLLKLAAKRLKFGFAIAKGFNVVIDLVRADS